MTDIVLGIGICAYAMFPSLSLSSDSRFGFHGLHGSRLRMGHVTACWLCFVPVWRKLAIQLEAREFSKDMKATARSIQA